MTVRLWANSDTDGEREVTLEAPGKYAPDVMNDLMRRAVEAWREMAGYELLEAGAEIVDPDSASG
jgi:hypothetical protein